MLLHVHLDVIFQFLFFLSNNRFPHFTYRPTSFSIERILLLSSATSLASMWIYRYIQSSQTSYLGVTHYGFRLDSVADVCHFWTAQSSLHFIPCRPVQSNAKSTSLGGIRCNYSAKAIHILPRTHLFSWVN